MSDLHRMVTKLNIDRYQHLLATEVDATRRKLLLALLAEEEAKLARLTNAPRGGKS